MPKPIFTQISNPRETYIDGYGVEREVYEPKIITTGRAIYNALFGEPEVNGIKIKASTAPLPTIAGKLPTITKRGVAILNAAKEGDAARAVSLIPDYYGGALSKNPARAYWPKVKDVIEKISSSGKLTGKQAETVLKSKPMQHIFDSYKNLLGQQPTSRFSSNAWYNGVIKAGKNIENSSSNVKSMYQARLNRATKALEDANGVVTKIGADGKPFKIYPKGMSLRSTSFETGLPTQFANDFSVDDIGQYVVIDGSKFHLYKRGGGLKIK